MTEKTKKTVKNIAWIGLGGATASVMFWIFLQTISIANGFGGMMSVPQEVQKVKQDLNRCHRSTDSIGQVFLLHNAIQLEQVKSINEKLDILIGERPKKIHWSK